MAKKPKNHLLYKNFRIHLVQEVLQIEKRERLMTIREVEQAPGFQDATGRRKALRNLHPCAIRGFGLFVSLQVWG